MNFFNLLYKDAADAHGACIAIFGAGGKTSLLYRIGEELACYYRKVLLTSLTKSGYRENQNAVLLDQIEHDKPEALFETMNPVMLMQSVIERKKYIGISEEKLRLFWRQADVCLFECDGARKRSLKIHTDHDPSIPSFTDKAIIVVGADVVNTKLSDGRVHRPELFSAHWNCSPDSVLSVPFITRVVTSEKGYLRKIPPSVDRIYFINKADTFPEKARRLASSIAGTSGRPVFYGSVRKGFYHSADHGDHDGGPPE